MSYRNHFAKSFSSISVFDPENDPQTLDWRSEVTGTVCGKLHSNYDKMGPSGHVFDTTNLEFSTIIHEVLKWSVSCLSSYKFLLLVTCHKMGTNPGWLNVWAPVFVNRLENCKRRSSPVQYWSGEAAFRCFSKTNKSVCRTLGGKNRLDFLLQIQKMNQSPERRTWWANISHVAETWVNYSSLRINLSTESCTGSKRISVQNKPRWGQTADLQQRRVMLCHRLRVSKEGGFNPWSKFQQFHSGSVRSARYNLCLWCIERLFVIYCVNLLNWNLDNCTLRHN